MVISLPCLGLVYVFGGHHLSVGSKVTKTQYLLKLSMNLWDLSMGGLINFDREIPQIWASSRYEGRENQYMELSGGFRERFSIFPEI